MALSVSQLAKNQKKKQRPIILLKDDPLPDRGGADAQRIDLITDAPVVVPKVQTKMVHVRSLDAIQFDINPSTGLESTTSFTIDLNNVGDDFFIGKDDSLFVTLNSAEIPYSFYNVNSTNNQLHISEDAASFTVTLTPANYNITEILAELVTKLDAASPNGIVYTMTYNNATNKVTILADGASETVTFDFTEATSINEAIGFSPSMQTLTADNVDQLISDRVVQVFVDHNLYLRTSLPAINSFETSNSGLSTILAKIHIDANPNTVLYYRQRDREFESELKTNKFSTVQVQLTDENQNVVNLNGLHFQFSLLFEVKKVR